MIKLKFKSEIFYQCFYNFYNAVVNVGKISHKMKTKTLLSIEKNAIEVEKYLIIIIRNLIQFIEKIETIV